MDRGPQTGAGRGSGRSGRSGRGGPGRGRSQGPGHEGGRGGRGGDRSHNRQPSTREAGGKDDSQHQGNAGRGERTHGGRGGNRDNGPGKTGRHARGASNYSSSSSRPGAAPDGGPTPAESTPQPSPTKGAPDAAPALRPQVSAGPKAGGSWANLLKTAAPPAGAAAPAAAAPLPGPAPTTSANNIATATAPAAPSAAAGTTSTPSSATAAAAAAASGAVAVEATPPQGAPSVRAPASAGPTMPEDSTAPPPTAAQIAARRPTGPRPEGAAVSAKPAAMAAGGPMPTPPIDYAAAVSANAPPTAATVVAGGAAMSVAAPVTPPGPPTAAGVVAGNIPPGIPVVAPAGAAPVSVGVPMVAANGVPISVGPMPTMAVPPNMPPISVQGPGVPGQNMPGSAGRGQGAAMSPRPVGPGPNFPGAPGATVMQAARPGPGGYPVYGSPVPYGGRMPHPSTFNMVAMPMNANPRMGPHYGQHMMPMGGRNYKQPHQGGRGAGRGAAAAAAASGSSGAPSATDGGTPTGAGGARRDAARAKSPEAPKQGLTIRKPGVGAPPPRTRPQSAVEPRNTPPPSDPFDVEGGKGMTTPRSQQRSASAISHRSDTGTPTLDSTPQKLTIRKPSGSTSKSPEKTERPTSAISQKSASPPKQEATEPRKGSPDENACPDGKDNGATAVPAPPSAAPAAEPAVPPLSVSPPKSAAASAADAAATAACAAVAASSTAPSVTTARETRSPAVSAAPSPTPPEDLPPPPPRTTAAAPSAEEPAKASAATDAATTATPVDTPLPSPPAKSQPPAEAAAAAPSTKPAAIESKPEPVAAAPKAAATKAVAPKEAAAPKAVAPKEAAAPKAVAPKQAAAKAVAPKAAAASKAPETQPVVAPPAAAEAVEALPPPPPKAPQPVTTSTAADTAPPPPTPAQSTEAPAPTSAPSAVAQQAVNGSSKHRYTRTFMCNVQNIPGESHNKFGITITREDLRNLTFDDLDDKFVGSMHKLLHSDNTGIIATEERRQCVQERQGNMRARRPGRGDGGAAGPSGGRGVGGRGGDNWEHQHQGGRGGRAGGRSGPPDHRQGGDNRGDQWGRRPGGSYNQSTSGNERQGGTATFAEWSSNKKAAPPPAGAEMKRAENAYKKGKLLSDDPEEEAKQRAFTALINKLTIDNFDKIVANMAKIEVLDAKTLKGFVTNIFNKALTESIFCEMYANLCKELTHCMPRFTTQEPDAEHATPGANKKVTQQDIRSLVLSECQYQFTLGRSAKNGTTDADQVGDESEMTDLEKKVAKAKRDEVNLQMRRRAMGNMQFVGHLYKAAMITEKIVHICIQDLLRDASSEEVECVCKLLVTAGPYLQNAKHNPELFPVYLARLEAYSAEKEKFDSRIRFLILDTLELANNSWQGRTKVDGPRRIDEIHKDAMIEEQKAKARSNTRGGYGDRHGHGGHGGHGHGGHGHGGGPPRPPQMDTRVNPRTMNVSTLQTGSVTGGRPGGMRRSANSGHDGSGGGSGNWGRHSGGHRDSGNAAAAPLPPPPPARQAQGKVESPRGSPCADASGNEAAAQEEEKKSITTEEIRRKVKLMIGEFGSSQKESEAVLSCKELMACGASAPAVHANLLCELTSLYKDEAQFAEKRAEWLQMLEKPLEGSCGKDVLQVLMALLPELFDENVKAVTLIGTSLGDMIVENQLTPTELFELVTASEEEGEDSPLVDGDHAAPLFMAALTASETDIPALKASAPIDAKALLPSYRHKKLEESAAKTGLNQLL